MAILALADDLDDLRERVGRIVVGSARSGDPVSVSQLGFTGALMTLLHQTIMPNLTQTLEGQPALGPRRPLCQHRPRLQLGHRRPDGMAYADYVITEAGFASDLGFEKFMHIKARNRDIVPSAAVLVASVRALKWHGGALRRELAQPDAGRVRAGGDNLAHHIAIVKSFGLPAVVAVNRFGTDSP